MISFPDNKTFLEDQSISGCAKCRRSAKIGRTAGSMVELHEHFSNLARFSSDRVADQTRRPPAQDQGGQGAPSPYRPRSRGPLIREQTTRRGDPGWVYLDPDTGERWLWTAHDRTGRLIPIARVS